MTKKELSIYKRGLLIVTNEQFAVCYLVAKYQIIDKIPKFSFMIEDYAIECGMNQETFRRSVEKFKLLITGKDEDEEETRKEIIYPKLKNAYLQFIEMKEIDVYALAELSFTDENKNIGMAIALDKAANTDIKK